MFAALGAVAVLALIGWGVWSALAPKPLAAVHAALDRRDFAAASDLLTKHLAKNPNDHDARLLAARTARRGGDLPRAADHLSAYAKNPGPNETYALEVALLGVQRGNKKDAERLFAEHSAKPDSPDAPFVMEAFLESTLHALAPTTDEAISPDADDRAVIDRLHAAVDLWLRKRPAPADQVQGLVWKGRVYRYGREHAKALAAIRDALARDPDDYAARFYLAALLSHDAPDEALRHLERLHARHPNDQRARFALATAHRTVGHAAEARRLLDEMRSHDPNDLSALVELGLLNLDEGKVADAEPLLKRAHELAPNIAETNLAMSRYMLLAGKPDEAAKYRARFDEIEAARNKPTTPKSKH